MSTGNGVGLAAEEVGVTMAAAPVAATAETPKPTSTSATKAVKVAKAKPPVKQTVNILLDAQVHKHFADKAAEDERTLSMYLARIIKRVYEQDLASTDKTI